MIRCQGQNTEKFLDREIFHKINKAKNILKLYHEEIIRKWHTCVTHVWPLTIHSFMCRLETKEKHIMKTCAEIILLGIHGNRS